MTDLPDRRREDRKRLAQFILATLGGALVLGSAAGALYGTARDVVGALHDGGDDLL